MGFDFQKSKQLAFRVIKNMVLRIAIEQLNISANHR